MFRGDEKQRIGLLDLGLEARHTRRQRAFQVLIVHRQVADLDQLGVRTVFRQLGNSLSQLAVYGFAAVAAHHDGNLEFAHVRS